MLPQISITTSEYLLPGKETVQKVNQYFSGEDDPIIQTMCPGLSMAGRVKGWGLCFIVGWMISVLSFKQLPALFGGRPVSFALLYTFGNLVSLVGSFFLCGPKQQFEYMKSDSRQKTASLYVGAMMATLVAVVTAHYINWLTLKILIVVLVFVQGCSMVWYSLSFVPYGRSAVISCWSALSNLFF